MFLEERQQKILEIVNSQHSVKVKTLSEMLSTSEVTIRRDLEELQKQQKVVRTHGGAMSAYSVGQAVVAGRLSSFNTGIKQRIAKIAYRQINDYDTLLMDTSSTVHEMIPFIMEGPKSHLRIITTSLRIVSELTDCPNCQVQIVGGDVNYAHGTIEGSVALRFLREIRVDKCFIGINGIDGEFGFSTPRFEDADIKREMIHSSNYSFILSDHSKLGKTYLAKTMDPDCLIMDMEVPDFPYEKLENTNVIFVDSVLEAE